MRFGLKTTLALGAGALVWACSGVEDGDGLGDKDGPGDAGSGGSGQGGADGGDADGSDADADDAATGGAAGGTGAVDATAPTVVSVSPEDGAKGVTEDAVIVITFSEPMDKVATQAAYGSANASIKASEVTFAWNSAGTQLTVTPNNPLPYKEVTDPTAATQEFAFTLSTVATDKDGEELVADFESSFSSLNRVTQQLVPDLANSAYAAYLDPKAKRIMLTATSAACPGLAYPSTPGENLTVGIRSSLYSFPLSTVLTDDLESATLTIQAVQHSSTAWFADFSIDKLASQTLGTTTATATPQQPHLPLLGGTNGEYIKGFGTVTSDVRSLVEGDLASDATWSMFRGDFDGLTSSDASRFICNTMSLTVVYLVE